MLSFDVGDMRMKYDMIREKSQELQGNMQKIGIIVQATEGDWQGESGKAYEKKLLAVKQDFSVLFRFWEEYLKKMDELISAYEEHENEVRAKLMRI